MKESLFTVVRASNTGNVLGFRLGPLSVMQASHGWVDCYRNGYVIRFRRRALGFVPTTRYRSVNV